MAAATVALVLAVSVPAPAQGAQDSPAPGDGDSAYEPYGYPRPPAPDGPAPCQYEAGCAGSPQYPDQYVPPSGESLLAPTLNEEQDASPTLGEGDAPVEVANGDPDDAAALNGAIEAARVDRAGGIATAAASEPAEGGTAASGEVKDEAGAFEPAEDGEVASEETGDEAAAVEGAAPADGADGGAPAGGEDEASPRAGVGERASGGEDARTAEDGKGAAAMVLPDANSAPPLVLLGTGSVLLLGAGLLLRRIVR